MILNTETATPIASPTALNIRLIKAFVFVDIILLLALLCAGTFRAFFFDDSNINQPQFKRNNDKHKLPDTEHEFPIKAGL